VKCKINGIISARLTKAILLQKWELKICKYNIAAEYNNTQRFTEMKFSFIFASPFFTVILGVVIVNKLAKNMNIGL
jgi:hypothetical protein